MGLPLSFLGGLLALALYDHASDRLPGTGSLTQLLLLSWIALLPWGIARGTAHWIARADAVARHPRRVGMLLRLQVLVVPVCYAGLVFGASMPDVVARLIPEPQVVQLGVLCAPLVWMELSMRMAERRTIRHLDRWGAGYPLGLGPDRIPMAVFVMVPFFLVIALADLSSLDRSAWVFFHLTSTGVTFGLLLLVALLCVMLPFAFRWLMPVTRQLPGHLADDLRRTAESLGFPGSAVLGMRTGYRMVNAALVGPVRRPRYLILTDGLMSLLEPSSLRGVVAHEVGHAKANHPGLLVLVFGVVPLLLLHPVVTTEVPEVGLGSLVLWGGGIAVALLLLLRMLAHRFEYEADQLSAEALGGVEPCVRALQRVGDLVGPGARRSSFRHPSERNRIHHLMECDRDPEYRARFWRRGAGARRSIYALVLVAGGWSLWAHATTWPIDSAIWSFYTGEFEDAEETLAELPGDLPSSYAELGERLQSEVELVVDLGFASGPWEHLRDALADRAWERAVSIAPREDADALLPVLSVALYGRDPDPARECLYLLASAVSDNDQVERRRIRAHLTSLAPTEDVLRIAESLDRAAAREGQ